VGRKIIIDTDPGIDDSMAIFYALQSPELEVIGLTTVFGNAATATCTTNALRLLEIAGRTDIPVSSGAQRSLARPFTGGTHWVHGADGQGNTNLAAPLLSASSQPATQFIAEQVLQSPGEVTIAASAPLTNVALALLLYPDLTRHIAQIVLMGGNAYVEGNASPAAEANIHNDPESADIVLGADCPVTMIGLDVTQKVFMSGHVLDQIGGFANPRAEHLARILPFYRQYYRSRYGHDGIYVHDSTAISYLLNPSLFKTVTHPLRVETGEGISRGKTWPAEGYSDRELPWQGRSPVTIAVDVDGEAAIQMEMERLAH
jgi:inosine-uridine nucleoside N-ribohydrolase